MNLNRTLKATLAAFALLFSLTARAQDDTPVIKPYKNWKDVKSPELPAFNPPAAERFELDNGMVVYLIEDHELPLIELSMTLRFGSIHEPADKVGLSSAVASVIRSGGSVKYPGDKLDEMLESMAASVNVSSGNDSGGADLNVLKGDFDKALDILNDLLRNPAFPENKLELWLSQSKTGIARRNDSPGGIAMREFSKALAGSPDSPWARPTEYAHLAKIDVAALKEFHSKYYHPNMILCGVTGDFKKPEMLAKLKAAFGSWPKADVKLPDVPKIGTDRKAQNYFVERPRLNQTTVLLGHVIDLRRDNPDYAAVQMLNYILSGSMSSRMFNNVRTKKGLAYAVSGHAVGNYDRPGQLSCMVLTRNEQALEAMNAVKEEIVKIRNDGVTQDELNDARERILNTLVFNYDSPSKILGRQMTYEFYHYPQDFADKMLAAAKKVTVPDVNAAAKKYLHPDEAVIVAVGGSKGLEKDKTFMSLPGAKELDITIPGAPAGK